MPNRAAYWRQKVEAENPGAVVARRHRNGLDWMLPNGQGRLVRSIGPMHTLTGEEIDTDLEPGQGQYHSQTKAGCLDFGARFRAGGHRVLTPRADHPLETVELGACSYWNGHVWVPLPPVPPVRAGHQLSFDHGSLGRIRYSVKASFVATEITVGNEAQNCGWRWPVTLAGLTGVQDSETQARLVASSDGETAMRVSAPKWTDSSMPSKSGPVGWSFAGGFLTHDAAVLPADVVFPVVVR